MTLIASWVGVDSKKSGPKTASIYIVSDSRINWGKGRYSDQHAKVFGMRKHPVILGYCGDVLFPYNILNQVVVQADEGILFSATASNEEKFDVIFGKIDLALRSYPEEQLAKSFRIICAMRDVDNNFNCYLICWDIRNGLKKEILTIPPYSGLVTSQGSGAKEFEDRFCYNYSKRHNNYRTSRAIYQCFTDTLDEIKDHACGGVPQVMGLYRKDNAKIFGIVRKGKIFFMGNEVSYFENLKFVEWRNDEFERCDPFTLKILPDAQRQPKS
ncbi:hypothetical protein [Sphingobacterium detergens]|uniref:hypothetical protein n=1 Tax=Sphingobacterium detergens TaxID=1145106 RepID=UPI003AAFCCDD